MDEEKRHSISMENRERLTVTQVEDVESFDEEYAEDLLNGFSSLLRDL